MPDLGTINERTRELRKLELEKFTQNVVQRNRVKYLEKHGS